jgi:hypothetical protein
MFAMPISSSNRFAHDLILLFISLGRDNRTRQRQALAMNPLHSNQISPAERLDEIGDLLAAAFIRLQHRKSSLLSRDGGESSLDFPVDQRGHPTPVDRRMADG